MTVILPQNYDFATLNLDERRKLSVDKAFSLFTASIMAVKPFFR